MLNPESSALAIRPLHLPERRHMMSFLFINPQIAFFCFACRKESSQQQIVVPVSGIPYQMSTYQLTEENTDFSYRDKRHQSSMVTSIGPQ